MQVGQLVLLRFPSADLAEGRLRPVLLLARLPGEYDDWLICMISSQIRHFVPGFDELISEESPDFAESGLKTSSVIRVGRLAVVERTLLLGSLGKIGDDRLHRIKTTLAHWITTNYFTVA